MQEPRNEAGGEGVAELPPRNELAAALVENRRAFLSFLERRVGHRDVAEDVLQEAFARSLEKVPLESAESAVAWFYRVLRNSVIDHYRRSGASDRALSALARQLDEKAEPDSTSGTPSAAASRSPLRDFEARVRTGAPSHRRRWCLGAGLRQQRAGFLISKAKGEAQASPPRLARDPLLRGVASATGAALAGALARAAVATNTALRRRLRASTRRLLAPALLLGFVRHRVSPVCSVLSCALSQRQTHTVPPHYPPRMPLAA